MIKFFKTSLSIFIFLFISRFIPHPPNFTNLIALSFYVPMILGTRYIPIVVFSFIITDIFIGFHNTAFFTWSAVILICYLSKIFKETFFKRMGGVLFNFVFCFYQPGILDDRILWIYF